jgi:hypothetical protein
LPSPSTGVFILYNERESSVAEIVERLTRLGIATYFWRRDIPFGEEWETTERERLRLASAVLVFLGDAGWGPVHTKLTQQAVAMEKRVIPVLIGKPPESALDAAGGLFRTRRYADLRTVTPEALDALAAAIRPNPLSESGEFDGIVSTLVDGSEEARLDLLHYIQRSTSLDRRGLSGRLRREIGERFSAREEGRFFSAVRDPKKIASIRSWMISSLIWTEPDDAENRAVLLSHVRHEQEPDRNVRFWTLAGLYQRQVSYLQEATLAGRLDPELEVQNLAHAISPSRDELIEAWRATLQSDDFETVWPVLRFLRVVPMTSLVRDVCALRMRADRGSALAYDALYAMTHPDMARAAAPGLIEVPGIAGVVDWVIDDSRGSNLTAARNFSALLAAFEDQGAIDAALTAAAREPDARRAVADIRKALALYRRPAEDTRALFIAGYAADTINVEDDRLDIDEDVRTITAVMLAKDVTPPLAIGLFGDWGSGKSFFMQSMRAVAKRIADRARQDPNSRFCSEIVPIEFNAWHYADTNLWASLVTHLLEQLAQYVSPQPTPEEQQADLLAELSSAKAVVTEVEAERERTQASIDDRQAELQRVQREREEKEIKLADLRAADLQTLLKGETDLKADLSRSLDQLGVPAALNSVNDLADVVAEAYTAKGRLTSLLLAVLNDRQPAVLGLLLFVVLIVLPGIAWLVHHYVVDNQILVVMWTSVSQFVAVAAAATAVLRKALTSAKANLDRLENAKQRVDALIAARRSVQTSEEKTLRSEIAALAAKEQEVMARLAAATVRVTELESRIRSFKEGRSLARFLTDRTQSDDYRRHLGLISTIRRDFEALGPRLATARLDASDGLKRVDRIILYIDDLDRCPANKVMEVLQADHLLLAYPYFVVVVGVDPRWLLRSLETTYQAFQPPARDPSGGGVAGRGELGDLWATTPENYLEKIFQIPFNLRPMTVGGYKKLVAGLLEPASESALHPSRGMPDVSTRTPDAPGEQKLGPTTGIDPLAGQSSKARPMAEGERSVPRSEDTADERSSEPAPEVDDILIHDDALVVKAWETAFAERLFAFVPTPRAAKRFTNIYRILKAQVAREDLLQFEGTSAVPGDFQVPMLLLAILVKAPREALQLFPRLYEHAAAGNSPLAALRDLQTLELDGPPFATLAEALDPLITDLQFPKASSIYTGWLPKVSRFSFDVGRALDTQTSRAPAVADQRPQSA